LAIFQTSHEARVGSVNAATPGMLHCIQPAYKRPSLKFAAPISERAAFSASGAFAEDMKQKRAK
jgi:hypothetical protein